MQVSCDCRSVDNTWYWVFFYGHLKDIEYRYPALLTVFVISAEVTVVTVFILPFDILEVLPLGVLPAVGLEKPLSYSGLAQNQRYGGGEMREVVHHHHARIDLKK